MTHSLRTTIIAAALTALAAPALAGAPGPDAGDFVTINALPPLPPLIQADAYVKPTATTDARIAVARLDGGRLIPTPFGEEFDWEMLAKRTGATIEQLGAGTALNYVPEIPFDGTDTENKIDEIRLAAANEGYSHVILYGVGPDARWSSFGGKALVETGLSVHPDCDSWEQARAKALLVDSFTGEVLGAATAENIEHHIGQLADRVEPLITRLAERG